VLPYCLVDDLADPYHYVKIVPHPRAVKAKKGSAEGKEEQHDYIIIGGEDHPVSDISAASTERFDRLEKWARARWDFGAVDRQWSGQVMEPLDYLSFTGHNPHDKDNIFVHTGDSGHGLTHGVMAGGLIRDLILKKDTPYKDVYEPARLPLKVLPEYAKHVAQVNAQYSRYLSFGDCNDIEDIVPGEGAVVFQDHTYQAVYRAPDGTVNRLSAVCPHLKGVVCWNGVEKSWDCPVHGSRFDPYGKLLMGPAKSSLHQCTEEGRRQEEKQVHERKMQSELEEKELLHGGKKKVQTEQKQGVHPAAL